MEQTRRDALKKGAVGGALLWAAPAITTVSRASAVAPGTPPPPPTCVCTASGFAVSATGNVLGTEINIGPVENAVQVGEPGDLIYLEGLFTNIDTDADVCSAESGAALLEISVVGVILSAEVLTASVSAPCDCSGSGETTIASLVLNASDLGVLITGEANQVLIDAAGIRLVVNEQDCEGTQGVVRALHLTVDLIGVQLDLIVGEARAGNDNEACTCPVEDNA